MTACPACEGDPEAPNDQCCLCGKRALTDEEFAAAVEEFDRGPCVEIDALKAAITGLLKFHQEGDDGAELPREYWSPAYLDAVEVAEALLKGPNVEVTGGRDAGESPLIERRVQGAAVAMEKDMELTKREKEALQECARYPRGQYCWRVASMTKLEAKGFAEKIAHADGYGCGAWVVTDAGRAAFERSNASLSGAEPQAERSLDGTVMQD